MHTASHEEPTRHKASQIEADGSIYRPGRRPGCQYLFTRNWVDRSIRDWNSDQVNQRQAESDRDWGEAFGRPSSVAPIIPLRKNAVSTTSATKQERSEYPPGECAP
jgi:hypothetical protein